MTVLLLGSSGPLNLKVVYCLVPLRVRVHLAATCETNLARRSRHVDAFVVHPGVSGAGDTGETIAWLRDYCARHGIEVVIPGDIGTAGFLAAAAASLEGVLVYPCSGTDLLDRLHDKWLFASTLMKAGLATPRTALIATPDDAAPAAAEIGFPLIVKPLSGESSHGVLRFDALDPLIEHVRSGRPYSTPPLIAQQYLHGRDIDISVLAEHGQVRLAVTQQLERNGALRFFPDAPTRRLADAIIAEYGYHGVAHFDMRVDERTGRVSVLECNPRFWYSMPAAMWQGVNFVEAGIRAARGEDPARGMHLVPGQYYLPKALLDALRRPWKMDGVSLRNLRGVVQPLLDPAPHLTDWLRKGRGQG